MRTTKVTQSLGITINLGNYESARVDVSMEVESTNDDDSSLAMAKQAQYQVRTELWDSIQPFIGGWSPQRKLELAQRLGVRDEELEDAVTMSDAIKSEARRKLGL